MILHTGLRDAIAEGWSEDEALAPLHQHAQQNPMLFQKICSRLVIPLELSCHSQRYFLIAPLFLEDRETPCIVQDVVAAFWAPSASPLKQARALHKCIFSLGVRRMFRSHPVLWAGMWPSLKKALQGCSIVDRFDTAVVGDAVRQVSIEHGISISKLYGSGQHWFAPDYALDDEHEDHEDQGSGEGWLQHSLALVNHFRKILRPLAQVLLDTSMGSKLKVQSIEKHVLTMPGGKMYLSKFVQGDLSLISRFATGLVPMLLDSAVSCGPGPVKFLQKALQDPASPYEPRIPSDSNVRLQLLQWLSDTIILAMRQQLSARCNVLGTLVEVLFLARQRRKQCRHPFPCLHSVQVRGCITHVAYISFHRYRAFISKRVPRRTSRHLISKR